jgi:hypothetical protein
MRVLNDDTKRLNKLEVGVVGSTALLKGAFVSSDQI